MSALINRGSTPSTNRSKLARSGSSLRLNSSFTPIEGAAHPYLPREISRITYDGGRIVEFRTTEWPSITVDYPKTFLSHTENINSQRPRGFPKTNDKACNGDRGVAHQYDGVQSTFVFPRLFADLAS